MVEQSLNLLEHTILCIIFSYWHKPYSAIDMIQAQIVNWQRHTLSWQATYGKILDNHEHVISARHFICIFNSLFVGIFSSLLCIRFSPTDGCLEDDQIPSDFWSNSFNLLSMVLYLLYWQHWCASVTGACNGSGHFICVSVVYLLSLTVMTQAGPIIGTGIWHVKVGWNDCPTSISRALICV